MKTLWLDKSSTRVLMLILVAALALRLWGIWFGLPYLYHPDENLEVIRALQLGAGSFDFSRMGKGGYFYLLFFEYAILFVVLKVSGAVQSTTDFALSFIQDPSVFYLIGRATTALLGTLTVLVVYLIGKTAYSTRAGILGALFLTFNYLHASTSHFITVDVPMTFALTLAILFAVRISQSGQRIHYILAAVFAGLAVITKLPAILLVIPLLMAHFFCASRQDHSIKEMIIGKNILTASTVFVVVVLLGNPGLVLNFGDFVTGHAAQFAGKGEYGMGGELSTTRPNLFFFYLAFLKQSMGWLLFMLALMGIGYGLWRRKQEDLLFTIFVIIYFLVLSTSSDPIHYYGRYLVPVLPMVCLLCGRFLEEMSRRILRSKENVAMAALACVMILEPGYAIVRKDHLLSQKDTRTYARDWIDNNIPSGTKIFIGGNQTRVSAGTVPLQNSRENILKSIELYKDMEPGKARYFKLALSVLPETTYDLVLVGPWDLKNLACYKQMGVEYMVLRPGLYSQHRKYKALFEPFSQHVRNDPQISLIKKFAPDPINRPGPIIEIYRVEGDAEGVQCQAK